MKIALFGLGRIGQVHLSTLLQHPNVEVAGIVDPMSPILKTMCKRANCPVLTTEEVFQDSTIDAVLIASPSDTHIDLIEQALKAKKAILCEKPIDVDINRVKRIVKKISAAKVLFGLGFNRRFDDSFAALKERLDKGEIGTLENLTITSRDPAPPPISYIKVSGGIYMDMTIHDFDIANWIVGEPIKMVFAQGNCKVDKTIGRTGDIDSTVVNMETKSGKFVQIINCRRASYGYDQRVEAFGSKGMLRVENVLENNLSTYTDSIRSAKPMLFFLERYQKAYMSELNAFVEAFTKKKPFLVNHLDGLKAMELALAAKRSLKSKKPVYL